MKKSFENIIWDWNGTLLNDVNLCIKITNSILKKNYNKELDLESYQAAFGFPITDYYQKVGIDLEKHPFEVLTKIFIADYGAGMPNCKLHSNTIQVLETFQKKGLNQYILTAAHQESVLPLLDFHEIRAYFKQVVGLDNFRAESKIGKGIELVSSNNINPQKTVLIGDTIHDYEVANEIGVSCILIANGHQSKERLNKKVNNNIQVIDQISQLVKLIL